MAGVGEGKQQPAVGSQSGPHIAEAGKERTTAPAKALGSARPCICKGSPCDRAAHPPLHHGPISSNPALLHLTPHRLSRLRSTPAPSTWILPNWASYHRTMQGHTHARGRAAAYSASVQRVDLPEPGACGCERVGRGGGVRGEARDGCAAGGYGVSTCGQRGAPQRLTRATGLAEQPAGAAARVPWPSYI